MDELKPKACAIPQDNEFLFVKKEQRCREKICFIFDGPCNKLISRTYILNFVLDFNYPLSLAMKNKLLEYL